MTVFADLAFLIGSVVCGLTLHLAAISLDLQKPLWKYLVAAFCGGVLSSLLLLIPGSILYVTVGGIASVSVLFWGKNFLGTVRNTLRTVVIALLYTGLLLAVSAAIFGLSVFFGDKGGYFVISFPKTVLSVGVSYGVFLLFLRGFRKIRKQPPLCDCVAVIYGKKVLFRAYVDTGNFLVDPISQKSVVVLEYRMLKNVFGKELPAFGGYEFYVFFGDKARSIPYRSISGDGRMLPAFVPDFFSINGERRRVVIAVSDRALESQGRFSGIISPDLIGGIEDENR